MSEPSGPRPPPERISALVVIYDIRGFTAASRRIPASELGAFAEAAHRSILSAFASPPPTFVKNLGDGHLLLWEQGDRVDPALAARVVAAVEEARASFSAFVASRLAQGRHSPARVGFGVAFGEVSRSDDWYGVALNRASRLQDLARPEGLALDPHVFDAAAGEDPALRAGLREKRVRLKGLGRTVAWVRRPFSWARLGFRAGLVTGAALALSVAYAGLADARVPVPGARAFRDFLDERGVSAFRPVRAEAEVRQAADRARRALAATLLGARTPEGAVRGDLAKPEDLRLDVWGSSQAICALLRAPGIPNERLASVLPGLALLFEPAHYREREGRAYGWIPHPGSRYTEAEPALWTAAAVAAALARPGLLDATERRAFEGRLQAAQRAADAYRPLDTGGWNTFPDQEDPAVASPYSTGLALLALLETRAAGRPWGDSTDARDRLLVSTARFLAARFVADDASPGWRGTPDSSDPISFGFTFQAYATLLRAESDAGVALDPRVAAAIPEAIRRLDDRAPESLRETVPRWDTGEFSIDFLDLEGKPDSRHEAINFLWHPWAVETTRRWLDRAARPGSGAPDADLRRARRLLGTLVVDLEEEVVRRAVSGYTFVASETLYGLSSVEPEP